MADLLADIKAKPKGTFTSSGSGIGGPWHMAIAGLTKAAGLPTDQVRFVPSRGGAPALQDVVSGGITMFTGSPAEAKALSDAGEVRVIAVLDEKRVSSYPDVPTLKEATGLDFTLINWFSLVLPKGVPADVRAKIVAAAAKAHAMPETRAQLAQRGFTPLWDGPDNFRTFAAGFSQTAGALLKDLGLAK
jgi:tripartite-type tricarboxylate transporter receptor subunit TctC